MTPKEKAKELFTNMLETDILMDEINSKKCALIAVELHLKELSKMKLIFSDRQLHEVYWINVKQEIDKL
jgi:hypothetical protein